MLMNITTSVVDIETAPAFALSFEAGRPVSTPSARTFADGLACRDPQPEPVAIICGGAARILRLSDAEIADAMRFYYVDTHNIAESAGAAALAGLMRERARYAGKRVALICSGGNIDLSAFAEVLAGRTPAA